jgi:regulator of protease activity HflC (stomatin/prohibitin superfamily)
MEPETAVRSAIDKQDLVMNEHPAKTTAGASILGLCMLMALAGAGLCAWGITELASGQGFGVIMLVAAGLILLLAALIGYGLIMVSPGQARVLQFFGSYAGTVRTPGFHWVNPFTTRHPVSTKIRNHETPVLKVNEAEGSPVEIAVVVVWRVSDTARALFEVDDFVEFVRIQTESAVRHVANEYPYDSGDEGKISLRDNADEITAQLVAEIADRVEPTGVEIIESRITHLAYAQEVAHAMLQRQQASAVIAARQRIVEGAVGMVELALERLAEQQVVELDEERKAAMVSNLLVVLCGDRSTQPIVNTGSLYH